MQRASLKTLLTSCQKQNIILRVSTGIIYQQGWQSEAWPAWWFLVELVGYEVALISSADIC